MFLSRRKPPNAHARDGARRPPDAHPDRGRALSLQPPADSSLPEGHRDGVLRLGVLLGRGAQVLAARQRHLMSPPPATRAASRRTRPTTKCAPARPVTPRPCSSPSIPRSFPTRRCSRRSGRATIRPRACARATTPARSTVRPSTRRARPSASPPRHHATCSLVNSRKNGYGAITTEIAPAGPFYFAEDYHQQYLAKNPGGYCGLGGTGVSCPAPVMRCDDATLELGN